MIVTLFEPIVRNIWQLFSHILGRAASQKESIARWRAQGKASRLLEGSLVWGLSQKSMPSLQGIGGLWHNTSEDIVHDASCGHIMPYPRGETGRALSPPDAAHTDQTIIEASHPCLAEGLGGSQTAPRNARVLQTCARSAA
jgi:hypothetical protein